MNKLKTIDILYAEGGLAEDFDFYFIDSEEPFKYWEFEVGSPTRNMLAKITHNLLNLLNYDELRQPASMRRVFEFEDDDE